MFSFVKRVIMTVLSLEFMEILVLVSTFSKNSNKTDGVSIVL